MASSDELSKTRWRAGMWPNSPPPLPALGFEGPIGLWEGGAFVSYELAEHQGFLGDKRLRHPPMRPSEDRWTANLRRYARWEREEQSGRGEIYLQVGRLDLDDVAEILDFVSTFDVLNVRALDPPRVERQWYALAPPRPLPLRVLRHYPGFGDEAGPVMASASDCTLREAVVATCQAERDAAPIWVIDETIEEFRWGARAIRDLHTAWCCLRDGDDPRSQPWANACMPRPTDDRGHAVWVTKSFLECTVSDTLEGFSPRMWLIGDRGKDRRRVENRAFPLQRGAARSPAPCQVTLFEVLVLELFRHIVEDAPFKSCQNPACGRTFVRQEGRAAHGQSRMTGVMYCSRTCSKAVAQRRYRSRLAAGRTPVPGTVP